VVRVGAGIRAPIMFLPYLDKKSKSTVDDRNKSNLHGTGYQEVEGNQLALDTVQLWIYLSKVMDFRVA
jgi:hypothetical protein